MRYLLDTNILSDLIKNPAGNAARRIRGLAAETVCTSIIVAGELHYGGHKKKSALLQQRIDELLAVMTILPLESACTPIYGQIRADLESKGTPIGGNDLWIAAHALASGSTLVTDNLREFSRIPGLLLENWLRD